MGAKISASHSAPRKRATDTDEWGRELAALGETFRRVARLLIRLRGRDTHLGGAELSHAQYELLIELYERGELSVGELAAAARLTAATVTQMLEHLAESGHVERRRSPTDKRVVVSCLTPLGRRKIEAKHRAWQDRWQQVLAGVDPAQLRAATAVLERLSALFEELPAERRCDSAEARASAPDPAAGASGASQ